MLGYGSDYDVEITDPFSGETQKVKIDLSEIQTKDVDLNFLNEENKYKFFLPISKKEIEFKFLTHKDEKDINAEIQALERLNKGKVAGSEITTRLKYMLLSVEGNTDRAFINKFATNMLAGDNKAFRQHLKNISPDLDLTFKFTSEVTGETEALDIPFGVNFFYPSN